MFFPHRHSPDSDWPALHLHHFLLLLFKFLITHLKYIYSIILSTFWKYFNNILWSLSGFYLFIYLFLKQRSRSILSSQNSSPSCYNLDILFVQPCYSEQNKIIFSRPFLGKNGTGSLFCQSYSETNAWWNAITALCQHALQTLKIRSKGWPWFFLLSKFYETLHQDSNAMSHRIYTFKQNPQTENS